MRLTHVRLIDSDFADSGAFYSTLGLILSVHEPPRYAQFQCPAGDELLLIEIIGEPARIWRGRS
jgi:catechol 2,3-dioxygenase-like lactoylglutathione lyase family enzyme